MKTIYLILTLLVVYASSAQDQRLFENPWYLHNLIIEGESHIPPVNTELPAVPLLFYEPNNIETYVCLGMSGTVNFVGLDQFDSLNAGMTLEGCEDPTNSDFDIFYMVNFFEDHYNDVFNYSLVVDENSKLLTITNASGNQAIYGNEILSTPDLYVFQFSIYPNPTSEVLNIEGNTQIENVLIHDLLGGNIMEISPQTDKIQIDLNHLNDGVYLVCITSEGKRTTRKIVKK